MIHDEDFAAATLREVRRRAQLSQQALAAAAGVAPSVLSAYETGARQPSAKMLARLVRASGAQLAVVEPGHERWRQKADLELAIGTASALPRRAPGPLTIRPFHQLISR